MKPTLEELFLKTIEDIRVERILPEKVRISGTVLEVEGQRTDLGACDRLIVVAMGKAAYPMVQTLAGLLPPLPLVGVVTGVLATRDPGAEVFERLTCFDGGHPYPNRDSVASAAAALDVLRGAGRRDLVLYLLSGGGSSMCEQPLSGGVSPRDSNRLYELLVTSGLTIREINYIRKHLSAVKGGRMT